MLRVIVRMTTVVVPSHSVGSHRCLTAHSCLFLCGQCNDILHMKVMFILGDILCSVWVCVFYCTCFHIVFFEPIVTAVHIAVFHVVCSLVSQSWQNVLNISITSDSIRVMHVFNLMPYIFYACVTVMKYLSLSYIRDTGISTCDFHMKILTVYY